MAMRTPAQIDQEIKYLKAALKNVKGTECERYSKIVGYYRPLRAWNAGKAAEYKNRVNYSPGKI